MIRLLIALFLFAISLFASRSRRSNPTIDMARDDASDQANKWMQNSLPRVTDAEHRVSCDEIADVLARKWRFKFHVMGLTALALFSLVVTLYPETGRWEF